MFATLVQSARRSVHDAGASAGVWALVGLLAAVAVFFFTLAAFVWIEAEYGTFAASASLGGFFLTLSAIVAAVWALRSRRRRQAQLALTAQELAGAGPDWWISPLAIATGIELLRVIGARRFVPAFTLGAVMLAALQGGPTNDETTKSTKKTTAT